MIIEIERQENQSQIDFLYKIAGLIAYDMCYDINDIEYIYDLDDFNAEIDIICDGVKIYINDDDVKIIDKFYQEIIEEVYEEEKREDYLNKKYGNKYHCDISDLY